MICHWYKTLVTVIDESTMSFVILQATREDAIAKLISLGVADPESVLDMVTPRHVWRATHATAAAASILAIEQALGGVADTSDVTAVKTELSESVESLKAELAHDRLESERHELQRQLESERVRIRNVLIQNGQYDSPAMAERVILQGLENTAAARRLREISNAH